MKRIDQSTLAIEDLVGIWTSVAQHNVRAADQILEQIEAKYAQLAQFPEGAEKCDFIRAGLRRSTVGNYVVYYRVQADSIEILRVLHGARDTSQEL